MKAIRRSVFETNSSSTHSITMCARNDYEMWKNGETLLGEDGKFYTKENAIEYLKSKSWYKNHDFENAEDVADLLDDNFKTYDKFGYDYEQFEDTYITPSGEEVIAFGYYGMDN